MSNDETSALPQCNIIVHEDIADADNVTDMICPLCRGPLKLYLIHYDEKFLMCSDMDCAYPFGVADYHIYKIECNVEFVRNECGSGTMSGTSGSTISNSDWSELDRMLQNPDNLLNPLNSPHSLVEKPQEIEKIEEVKKSAQQEKIIMKNVKEIQKLNKRLYEEDSSLDSMNNDKWIKHIADMQERTGVQLLKKHELKKVKKMSDIGLGELKINIETSRNAISLRIGVPNKEKEKQDK